MQLDKTSKFNKLFTYNLVYTQPTNAVCAASAAADTGTYACPG